MSSDDTDNEGGTVRYKVFQKRWRSREVKELLSLLDTLYQISRTTQRRGGLPLQRVQTVTVSEQRPAVLGLPVNAYDSTWLDGLNNLARQALKVDADPHNFTNDPSVSQ